MLRLRVSARPRWLDLAHGVRVLVRPVSTAISEAAFAEALERIRPVKAAAEDAVAAGAPLPANEPNGANAAWLQGLQWQFMCEAYARYGILEWEGVGDDDGAPLPLSAAGCAAFAAHPDLGRDFYRQFTQELDAVSAEGNGSAPSADGGTAGAAHPAAAALTAPPGPAPEPANDQAAPVAPAG